MTMEERVSRLEKRFEDFVEKSSETHRRIYDKINDLSTATAVQNERYDTILSELEELKKEIKKLTEQPQKRWDTAITSAISAAVGGVVGFIVSKLFGGM